MNKLKSHYLYPGTIFTAFEPHLVLTILGSCVSVCLWDDVLKIGGINHYNLPLWNGEGLASPKYGNIAIKKLIEKMHSLDCKTENLKAKIFGGASLLGKAQNVMTVGNNNVIVARDMLKKENIPIISYSVGGNFGRKLKFFTHSGVVMMKKVKEEKSKNEISP